MTVKHQHATQIFAHVWLAQKGHERVVICKLQWLRPGRFELLVEKKKTKTKKKKVRVWGNNVSEGLAQPQFSVLRSWDCTDRLTMKFENRKRKIWWMGRNGKFRERRKVGDQVKK